MQVEKHNTNRFTFYTDITDIMVSGWLGQSAEYVRQFDYEQAEAGVRQYVGRSPGRSLLIASGVGLFIGAILRRR